MRGERRALAAPRVLPASAVFGVEDDVAGDVADRERAVDAERVAALLDALALEHDRREFFGVEEVGRLEVGVTLRLARVDARDLDPNLHRRLLERGGVERELPVPGQELAVDLRDHHVTNGEPDARVCAVDLPFLSGHCVLLGCCVVLRGEKYVVRRSRTIPGSRTHCCDPGNVVAFALAQPSGVRATTLVPGARRGSQVVRQWFAKPSYVGSNPIHASEIRNRCDERRLDDETVGLARLSLDEDRDRGR